MTLGVLPDLQPVTLLMQASSDLLVPLLGISAGKWQVCDVPHMRVRLAIACGFWSCLVLSKERKRGSQRGAFVSAAGYPEWLRRNPQFNSERPAKPNPAACKTKRVGLAVLESKP